MKFVKLVLVLLVFMASAAAETTVFDQAALIDGLARQGMDELLERLAETDAAGDPVLVEHIRAARQRIAYRNATDEAQRQARYDESLQELRKLMAAHPNHALGPIWQTDLAELLLIDGLGALHHQAILFAALGVATNEQRRAIAELAREAMEVLPPLAASRNPPSTPGEQFLHDYQTNRIPYLQTCAAHAAALMDNDSNDRLKAAIAQLEQTNPTQRETRLLLALGRLRLNETQPARETLQSLLETPRDDLTDFTARLTFAAISPSNPAAFERLSRHPQARDSLLLRLLLADAQHLQLLRRLPAEAQPRRGALGQAYAVYRAVLADLPPLAASQTQAYLAARWLENLPAAGDLNLLPDWVALAIGRAVRGSAAPNWPLAQRLLARVADQPDADSALRSAALHELGWVALLSATNRAEGAVAAAQHWLRAADEFPDQPPALPSLTDAANQLLAQGQTTEAYAQAVERLLARYPGSDAAHDQRYPYATRVLLPAAAYEEAIETLTALPIGHADYLPARAALLRAQVYLYQRTPEPQRPSRLRLRETAAEALTDPHLPAALSIQIRLDLAALDIITGDPDTLPAAVALIARLAGAPDTEPAAFQCALNALTLHLDRLEAAEALAADDADRQALRTTLKETAGLTAQIAARGLAPPASLQKLTEVRTLRLAGDPQHAARLLEPLLAAHPDNAEVILEAGLTHLALDTPADLRIAATHLNRVIQSFNEPPYPDLYWQAWLARLGITAELEDKGDVPLRIRQLRLRDPELGGERYRVPLERMERESLRAR